MKRLFAILLVLLSLSGQCFADTHTADSCSLADVNTAIGLASAGDTVVVPAGSCTWGTKATHVTVNKAITLQGADKATTIITLADDGGSWADCVIAISAAATVKSLTIIGSNVGYVGAFSTSTVDGWRITDINFTGGTKEAYFVYVGNVYGLIDNNTITGTSGSSEYVFVRGPTDSWQTAHSIGGVNNVFIENNTFSGQGYVSDCNDNSRCVVRYNTITTGVKIDGHGRASNSLRGVRHMEIYNNLWTYDVAVGSWKYIELRGGTGRIFNNVVDTTYALVSLVLTDYCYQNGAAFGGCGSVCACAADYPVTDQIGVGIDPKAAASEPVYLWNNKKGGVSATVSNGNQEAVCVTACGAFALSTVIQSGIDYYLSDSKPVAMSGYSPYTCPHPLAGLTGSCTNTAGTAGYNVTTGSITLGTGGSITGIGTGGGTITLE